MEINEHIIRYCKGHYGQTDDIMSDLRVIIGKWALLDPDPVCIPNVEVMDCVYSVFMEVASQHNKDRLLIETFKNSFYGSPLEKISPVDLVKQMRSGIRWVTVTGENATFEFTAPKWDDMWLGGTEREKEFAESC